jgi:hypothetical protein
MKPRVFLSYSLRDRKLATELSRALERLGVSAFDPAKVKAGSEWREAISEAIRRSDWLVVLMPNPQAGLQWTGYEVGYAEALGKKIVVMKSADHSIADFPIDLAGSRTLDVDTSSPEKMALMLVSSMKTAD